jgi:Right handed beta helix region
MKAALFLFFELFTLCGYTQVITFDLKKDFKAKGDGRSNDYYALRKAADSISQLPQKAVIVLNIPKGHYLINEYIIADSFYSEGGIQMKAPGNNIREIRFEHRSSLTINGYGSLIDVKGNFTRKADQQYFDYWVSREATVTPFSIINCQSVQVRDLNITGNVFKTKRDPLIPEHNPLGGAVGGNCGIRIIGDSTQNVLLENLNIQQFPIDGIAIACKGDVTINNSTSVYNGRLGLSIVAGSNITCLKSSFNYNGGKQGMYQGHNPQAGIDIENETGKRGGVKKISLIKCNMIGNESFQLVANPSNDNVVIEECLIKDKSEGFKGDPCVALLASNAIIRNSTIYGNIQITVTDGDSTAYVSTGLIVENNRIYSGSYGIFCANLNNPAYIRNNYIEMLDPIKGCQECYFPYINVATFRKKNLFFTNNDILIHPNKKQLSGLMQGCKFVANNRWSIKPPYTLAGAKKQINNLNYSYYCIGYDGTEITQNESFPYDGSITPYHINSTINLHAPSVPQGGPYRNECDSNPALDWRIGQFVYSTDRTRPILGWVCVSVFPVIWKPVLR